jgi:REP element-mobilizing transposase RayT
MVNQVDKLEQAAMPLNPLYRSENLRPAFQLRYSWTGWFKSAWPNMPNSAILATLDPLWEEDGIRRLEQNWSADHCQITFSAKPGVSPIFLARRAKGRLQYLLRTAGHGFPGFSRKVSVRSVGENTSKDVTAYIASQVVRETFDDARFRAMLAQFTRTFPAVDLADPNESARGRYWYNLHIVLVSASRGRNRDPADLRKLYEQTLKIADKKAHRIAAISMMPDHLHLALRGNIEQSPLDIALGFQNNLAYAMGQSPIWQEGFYAGTFSEYDMGAIRRSAALADTT